MAKPGIRKAKAVKTGATPGRSPGPRKIPQASGRLFTWRRKRR